MAASQETIRKALTSNSTAYRRRIPRWIVQLVRNPISMLGILIVLFYIAVALLAPVLAPPGSLRCHTICLVPVFSLSLNLPAANTRLAPPRTNTTSIMALYGELALLKVGLIITGLTVLIGARSAQRQPIRGAGWTK